ncbi:MAG: ABC transporter substrate-binding protein, partial [Promethearchaeota archaeon]
MKKNRILFCFMVILLITVCVYIPIEIPTKAERNENPNTSNPTETLIFGTDAGPSSLDPHYIWETASFNVIDQVVETLFAYDLSNPSLEIIPRLAADFGTWDATGLIYTVPIKTVGTDGNPIKFHDGTTFDANAVVSSFERLFYFLSLDPENPSTPDPPMFWELYHWPDGTPIINSVENVGGDIKFTLNRKFAPFEALLCFSGSGILSDDDISTPPNDYIDLSGDLVGTGPFNFISYTPYYEVRFQKFGDYWAGPAHIDELIFSIIPDTTARMNALLAGSIDYINTPERTMLQTFRESSHITLVESGGDAIIRCLGMNNQLIPLEMRKAISYAIDYYRIIEEYMDGEAIRLRSPIPLGIRDANWGFNVPETDIIKARQTLIDSGLYGTLPSADDDQGWQNLVNTNPIAQYSLVYYWDTNNPRMVLVDIPKRNLKRIGVRVLEERISWEEYLRRGAEDRDMLELFWLGWGPDYNDPCDYINFLFADDGTSNFGQVNDEIVQGWIDQAISELDSGIRETHYDNIQKRLVEEVFPWCWGYVERNWDAFSNDFTGFQSNPMEKLWFHSVRRTITQVKSNWLLNPVNVNGFVSGGEWDDADAYIVPLNLTWGWPNRQTVPSGEQLTVRFKNDAEWLYILYEIPYSELGATEPESAGIASWFYYGSQSDNGWVGLGGGKGDQYGWNGVVWNTDTNNDVEGIGVKDDVNNIYRFEFKKRLDTGDGQDWSLWPGEVVGSPIAPAELPHIIVYLYDDEFYPKTFEQYISLQLSRPQLISNWLVNEVTLDGIASTGEWADTNLYNLPLYNVMGWPSTVWLRSNKVLTTRFKNDGEWLYMLYEIPWIWSDDPPDSAGISLFSFFGNPRTNTDSGWLQIAGDVPVDYYGWNGYNWLFDTDVSGQNDVEGVGVIDGNIYRIEFRKRLDSKDGWDWSLTPGETVGNPFGPPSLAISLYDAYTNSVYEQYISLNLMRSNTIHITNDFTLTTDLYFEAGDGIVIDADDITIDGNGHKIIGSNSGCGIITGWGSDSLMIKNVTIQEFFAGIALFGFQNSNITGNYISENKMGIILSAPSTLNELTNNIITR